MVPGGCFLTINSDASREGVGASHIERTTVLVTLLGVKKSSFSTS